MSVTFDASTGQVFKEWTLSRRVISAQGDNVDWHRKRPYPLLEPGRSRGPLRSLIDMTISVIANNIGEVTDEHLEHMPPHLRWQIWRFLEARGVCLHAWKLFSKQLLREEGDKPLGLHRFRQHIRRPAGELERYTQPLTSLSVDFVTHLVISGGCEFSSHELLSLARMRNLGALELIQPEDGLDLTFPRIDDRLLRGWTDVPDAFPLLRILRIWGAHSVTRESLRWISKFPSLKLYDVVGSREDWHSPRAKGAEYGWGMSSVLPGVHDSLSQYLLLFAPDEEDRSALLKDSMKVVDLDLLDILSDPACSVRPVGLADSPSLLEYLTNALHGDKQPRGSLAFTAERRSEHEAVFEAWAFWLYSMIGQVTADADLAKLDVQNHVPAATGPFVLPSKAFASLFLGQSGREGISCNPAYVSRGLFVLRRHTFTRPMQPSSADKPRVTPTLRRGRQDAGPSRSGESGLRKQKRQRLADMLHSLSAKPPS